jgi:hypothetical protein
VHVGSDWTVRCSTYPNKPPILTLDAGDCGVSICVAENIAAESTTAFARELVKAAQRFAGECERLQNAAGDADAAGVQAA